MLTVLSVAYPLAPVGTDSVGCAEQILAAIDEALVAAGHRSIVVACEGSRVAGELVVLATLHMPLSWYPRLVFELPRPATFLACVSRAQRRCAPAAPGLLGEIEDGVDLERLRPAAAPGDHALVLGRICPEKAPHLALDAATLAGVPLVLAGKYRFGATDRARLRRRVIRRGAL